MNELVEILMKNVLDVAGIERGSPRSKVTLADLQVDLQVDSEVGHLTYHLLAGGCCNYPPATDSSNADAPTRAPLSPSALWEK